MDKPSEEETNPSPEGEEEGEETPSKAESEKPKDTREPSPEPCTSFETASSTCEEPAGRVRRRRYRNRRFDSSSSSSDEEKEEKSDDKELSESKRNKNKKKRFMSPSSSSSSSSSSSPAINRDAANEENGDSSDSFVSFENRELEANSDSDIAIPSDDDDDFLIFSGQSQRAARNLATDETVEKPYVLRAPEAKPKYSFIKDYKSLQLQGDVDKYIRHCMGQLNLVRRFELGYKLKGHKGCVNCIHFNEAGSLLASGSDDLKIFIWDWQKRKNAFSFKSGHTSNIFQTKFLPFTGDTHLVSASRDGQIRLAELSSTGVCRSTKKLAAHSRPAHKLALLDSSPHCFVSAGEDGVIIEIDVRQPKQKNLTILREGGRTIPLYSVHANPSNDFHICTAGKDRYVHLFDRRTMSEKNSKPFKKFCPHNLIDSSNDDSYLTCAVYNHDGSEIVASYNDEDIYLFNAEDSDGAPAIKRFQGHVNSATVKGVNFYGPKSEYIVSGSDCGNIFFWDKITESIVQMVHGDEQGVVNCLEPHPHLPVMATSGLDPEVKIWYPTSTKDPDTKLIEKTVMKNQSKETYFLGDTMLRDLLRRIRWLDHSRNINLPNVFDDDDDDDDDDDSNSSSEDSDEESNIEDGAESENSPNGNDE